jgi:hypothetical protein
MKNIKNITKNFLTEQYEMNRIFEAIEYDPEHPERMHPQIEDKLRRDDHYLSGNKSLPKSLDDHHFSEKVASKRFKDLVGKVKRYWGITAVNPMMIMQAMAILREIKEIEKPHRRELEQIAIDLVREEFDIPEDQVDMEAKLVDGAISDEGMQDDPEEPDLESEADTDRLRAEVQKRRMLNAIMQGAAKKGHYMFHMVDEEISALDPRLMSLYGKLMSITDLTYWMIPDMSAAGGGDMKGGRTYLDLSGDKPKIVAEAWIFPVLIHELIKGCMELLAAHGLPEDEREAKYVIDKADFLKGEVWDMRLGPGLWEKFIDAIEGDTYDIKHFLYYEIAQMPVNEFHQFMREILSGSQRGKQMLVDLANDIQRDIQQREADKALGSGEDYDDDDVDDIDISDLFN